MAKILFNKQKFKSRFVFTAKEAKENPLLFDKQTIVKATKRYIELKTNNDILSYKVDEKIIEASISKAKTLPKEKDIEEISVDFIFAEVNPEKIKNINENSSNKKLIDIPYLEVKHFHPHESNGEHTQKSELSEFRASQQKILVRKAQVIAVLKQKKVDEKKVTPETPRKVTVGAGVTQTPSGEFIAQYDGFPIIEGLHIQLEKNYTHQGDVNLSSGDIFISGDLVIKGNVEHGTRIQAGGSIQIEGNVYGGLVYAHGSISISGGVIGQPDSRIHTRGSFRAGFLQNANIYAGQDVTIDKAIVSSHVVSQGSIEVTSSDGQIFGGVIRCFKNLKVAKLGKNEGAHTDVKIGVHSDQELRVLNLNIRKNLTECIIRNTEHQLQTLETKSQAQTAKKHVELKNVLKKKKIRAEHLKDKLLLLIEKNKKFSNFNPDAKIDVSGKIASNTELYLADKRVPLFQDLNSLNISALNYDPKTPKKAG